MQYSTVKTDVKNTSELSEHSQNSRKHSCICFPNSRIVLVTVYCRVITLSSSDFREAFQNSRGKGEYYSSTQCFIQSDDTQQVGYVCAYV